MTNKVVHLLNDLALGGVTRLLDSLMSVLANRNDHSRLQVNPNFRQAPRINADIIVVHFTVSWSKLPFLLSLRARNRDARLILVEHSYTRGFVACCVSNRMRFEAMLKLAFAIPDIIVAVSSGQAEWIIEQRLASSSKVTFIPCILDLTTMLAIAPPVLHDGPMRLGAYGRFHRQKGFDVLLEAMRLVPQEIASLVLAGYGAAQGDFSLKASTLSNVTLVGPVNPVAFLSSVDAVAIPSRWEAGSVTCWEARAAARPVIVSSVDGLPEQVPPEIGLVVAPDDPVSLARAILSLAAADRGAMSRSARSSAVGAFERTVECWRRLLGERIGDPHPVDLEKRPSAPNLYGRRKSDLKEEPVCA